MQTLQSMHWCTGVLVALQYAFTLSALHGGRQNLTFSAQRFVQAESFVSSHLSILVAGIAAQQDCSLRELVVQHPLLLEYVGRHLKTKPLLLGQPKLRHVHTTSMCKTL